MDKPLSQRIARLMRLATAWAVAFHGFVVPWSTEPLYAKNPDTVWLGVQPISSSPPDKITDLVASPNLAVQGEVALTWTAPQGNAGGTPINNQPVVAYLVHYATFSVASLTGNTTSWWNSTSSSQQLLQAPSNTPKSPGLLEAFTLSGLTPGGTYYFGIKSISMGGITSPVDTLSESPVSQATAVTTIFTTSGAGSPKRPNGLTATSGNGNVHISWHPVTLDVNNQSVGIDHYSVYKYDAIGSTPTLVGTLGPNTTTYSDVLVNQVYYYRILAVSVGNLSSELSDYVDSSAELNRILVAADDSTTRVVVPATLAFELNSEHNGLGEDLEIHLDRRLQDEVEVTLRSYRVGVRRVISGAEVPSFYFSSNNMQVQLGLGAVLGTGQLSGYTPTSQPAAGSIAQIVSVYWFNGAASIRLSDPILTSAQSISVNVRNIGVYQVRATQISTVFRLSQNSPYPRVITPNDASQNNRVFWFFDNPTGDSVSGTIYDIRGAKVCDLAVDGNSPTSNSLVWTGRDSNGSVVPSGVYIYKITSGKEKATGTVVVAR